MCGFRVDSHPREKGNAYLTADGVVDVTPDVKPRTDEDPSSPYCVQLASLALEREWYRPMGEELMGEELEMTIYGMYNWKPESVRRYLEEDSSGDRIDIVTESVISPEDLAAAILSHAESKLSEPSGSTYPTQWKSWQLRDDE
jgi:hypothetical protein